MAARNILHAIGGENSVYFSTDRTGVPIVGGGLIMTPRDWARYGMLLGSGGMGVTGDMVGGGAKWVRRTMTGCFTRNCEISPRKEVIVLVVYVCRE